MNFMMNNLKTTTAIVKTILEEDERCRNSDSFLYLKVLSVIGENKGINIEKMSVPHFLCDFHGTFFPGFETVRRSRQRIQALYPHLAASERVGAYRAENEAEYRAYARGEA